jgi:hypothetical protein
MGCSEAGEVVDFLGGHYLGLVDQKYQMKMDLCVSARVREYSKA